MLIQHDIIKAFMHNKVDRWTTSHKLPAIHKHETAFIFHLNSAN